MAFSRQSGEAAKTARKKNKVELLLIDRPSEASSA
jgi:hypothetical protein